jgi:hypothetical protein
MKKILFLAVAAASLLIGLNSAVQASQDISVAAIQGKACDARDTNSDGIAGNDVMGNTTQLMTRNGAFPDAKKSWLQFDLTSVYAADSSIKGNLTNAKLTFYGANTETGTKSYALSGLNDAAGLENWVASALTWNNAPANNITAGNTLDTTKITSFYTLAIPVPVLDTLSETPEANRAALTSFLNSDTDGKVTFIFTAGGTCYLWNAGQTLGPVLTLTYTLGNNLEKAHYPVPADADVVKTTLSTLSWTNPAPKVSGGVITCDVYLGKGTEPNFINMDKKTLGAGVSSVAINTTNFPQNGSLTNMTNYCWVVNVHDSSDAGTLDPNSIKGQSWKFFTNNNQAPVPDAGADQKVWLGKSGISGQEVVTLNGLATDDGLPNPPAAMTYTWSQVANGAPTVAPSPTNTLNTSVTITARGSYEFQLMADDSNRQGTDTVKVFVGTNACDASNLFTGAGFKAGDINQDCDVNVQDILAIAAKWLSCTDTLTNCAR